MEHPGHYLVLYIWMPVLNLKISFDEKYSRVSHGNQWSSKDIVLGFIRSLLHRKKLLLKGSDDRMEEVIRRMSGFITCVLGRIRQKESTNAKPGSPHGAKKGYYEVANETDFYREQKTVIGLE